MTTVSSMTYINVIYYRLLKLLKTKNDNKRLKKPKKIRSVNEISKFND